MLVLFYSQNCEHSKNVILTIQKSSMQENIKMFCIDGFQPLPKNLTHVPTLKNYANNAILIGEEIIQWLDAYKTETSDIIQDQVAQSTNGYTMINDDTNEINEIDMVYNTRINTPNGQMPQKEESKPNKVIFPQDMAKLQSGSLDMALEQMMAEREKQFPTASPQKMDQKFQQMMTRRNNQTTI